MKKKLYVLGLFSFLLIVSCKNEPEAGYDPVNNTDIEYSPTESGVTQDTANANNTETREIDPGNDTSVNNVRQEQGSDKTASLSGTYIKLGEESDKDCDCYCLDINYNSTSELCLIPGEMYIETRMERSNNNTVNLFLVGPSAKNTTGENIPWEEFDKNIPIASVTSIANGDLQMNWLGFTSNGDLAMDYAIYGKKTLEGIYKKK